MVAPNHTISPAPEMAPGASWPRIFFVGKWFHFRHFPYYNRHHTPHDQARHKHAKETT
jgi:hypothetical protein